MTSAPDAMTEPTAPLRSLTRALVDDPAIVSVIGKRAAVLAVPEGARPLTIASIAVESDRSPVVVAVPTSSEAERLRSDLARYLGDDEVLLFPAWETLPFERVSPNVETMGRRLEVLWRLRDPAHRPRVVVASSRALVQRLGPEVEQIDPIIVGVGDQIDIADLAQDLVAFGYRREPKVEARGQFAVRGSIVDVYPSTATAPVRVDLWGCLLYTSPSPRDRQKSRMPSSA